MDRRLASPGPAFFGYADNDLIDVKVGIIMDVEATRAIRQAEVASGPDMIERTEQRVAIKPEPLAGDTADGSGANLVCLGQRGRDKRRTSPVNDSLLKREDGTFQPRRLRLRRAQAFTSARPARF